MKPLQMFLLAADKLIRCRWDGRSERLDVVNTALEGETLREVAQDPANPQRLYAATLTEIHVSEDGGESWKWLPAGGVDFRDIWAMAAHPESSQRNLRGYSTRRRLCERERRPLFSRAVGIPAIAGIPQVDLSATATHRSHSLHHLGRPRAGRNPRRHRRGRRGAQPR